MTDQATADPAFGMLQRFLGIFDLLAAAHAREDLSAEQEATLHAFVRGELDEGGRRALIPLLSRNTTALERLATLLKGPRGNDSGK